MIAYEAEITTKVSDHDITLESKVKVKYMYTIILDWWLRMVLLTQGNFADISLNGNQSCVE